MTLTTTALFSTTSYIDAPTRRHRIALRQVVNDRVARPATWPREALSFYADEAKLRPRPRR